MTSILIHAPASGHPGLSQALRFRLGCGAISGLALAVLFLRTEVPMPALLAIATSYGSGVGLLTLGSIILHFLSLYLRQMVQIGGQTAGFSQNYAASVPVLDILAGLGAITVTISSFTVYKSLVVGASGYHYDAAITALDRWFFAGLDGWQLTHWLLPTAQMAHVIDFLYHPAFMPMIIGYVICLGLRARPGLRYTYVLAYLISFVVIGMIGADLLNSAGPIYDGRLYGDGSNFSALHAKLAQHSQDASPLFSQTTKEYLANAYDQRIAKFGTGISAMPSMHIVMTFLWVFAGWSLGRTAGVLTTLYAVVIWVGSVHLGWHYFSDGLIGLAALAVIWPATAFMLRVRADGHQAECHPAP